MPSPQIRVRLPLDDSSKMAADDENYLVMAQNASEAYKDASEVVESWQSGCCVNSAGLSR
jgi:hypothetical protein